MIVSYDRLDGEVIRDNETYVVEDNTTLDKLTLSKTVLHPTKATGGHSHDNDEEEVYFFQSGFGTMQLDDQKFPVREGDIVLIKKGVYHRVFNDKGSKQDLVFVCVFNKYEREDT